MELLIQNDTDLSLNQSFLNELVREFLAFSKVSFDEASILFVDKKFISKLHADFFDDPSATDCISFPIDDAFEDGYRVMGEIFVCPEVAHEYISKNGGDFYKELTLYVVHGLLHLLGYDDIEEIDQKVMRKAEAEFLEHVNLKGLWLRPE